MAAKDNTMADIIVKVPDIEKGIDYYLIWSTNVDAPTTYGMQLDQFNEWYRQQYGDKGMKELAERMERVNHKGTSSYFESETLENLLEMYRLNHDHELTLENLITDYCREWKRQ